ARVRGGAPDVTSAASRSHSAPEPVQLCVMDDAHLPGVLALERAAFDDPWSEGQYRDELANAFAHCRVLTRGDAVVASLVFRAVAGEVELLRIATHPLERRAGLGRMLVQHLLTSAVGERVTLEVRRGNTAAIALYS